MRLANSSPLGGPQHELTLGPPTPGVGTLGANVGGWGGGGFSRWMLPVAIRQGVAPGRRVAAPVGKLACCFQVALQARA
jgi:hypothetical protein